MQYMMTAYVTHDIPYNAASNCLAKSPIVHSGREFGQITTCTDIL